MRLSTDIVVVGAGLSGLHAARRLRDAGLAVTVLEARDRVGGRLWSRRLGDGTAVDLGGQWIGPGQTRVRALADEFGLATVDTYASGDMIVDADGTPRRFAADALPIGWPGRLDVLQVGWRLSRLAAALSPDDPTAHPEAAALDRTTAADWIERRAFTEAARAYWRFIVEAGLCASADAVSALEVAHQLATIGSLGRLEMAEQTFFVGGAQALAQRLADDLGAAVRLGASVGALHANADGVRVRTEAGEVHARRAILAIPPHLAGPLLGDAASEPGLVEGQVVKAVLVYTRAWWRDAGLSGLASSLAGPVTTLLDGSLPGGRPGLLVALATGPHAPRLAALGTAERHAFLASEVDRLLGPAPERPREVVSTDWTAEPFSRGGYAARRGLEGWIAGTASGRAGPVHIAGTEASTVWRSYMEGALESAERAAAEVLASLHGQGLADRP